MKKIEKHRAKARKLLLPLIEETARAGNTLADWRRDAGIKSKWSNHARMQEIALFTAFEKAASALSDAFAPLIPEAWGMSDWGFKPHRMGGKLSWGNNRGRGRSGFEIPTQKDHYTSNFSIFAIEIGALAALATHHHQPNDEELSRMRELRLSSKEITRYALYTHPGGWRETDGHSPTEAQARLTLQGNYSRPLRLGDHPDDPGAAFDKGVQLVDDDLALNRTWTAAPGFFARLKADKRVSRLTGGVPDAYAQSGRIGPAHVEAFDRQTAMALALLDEIPQKVGKKRTFLVRPRGQKGRKIEAWCPNSAILRILLGNLFRKEIDDNDMIEWEVFAMTDEAGMTARQIAAQFEPLNPA